MSRYQFIEFAEVVMLAIAFQDQIDAASYIGAQRRQNLAVRV